MSKLSADSAIRTSADDALDRSASAHLLVDQILAIDTSDGLVVGVLGPWGAGKTSFINLAREELGKQSVLVVDFNPWMFSGGANLTEWFFNEIGAELALKAGLADLGKKFADFGEIFSGLGWLPFVGSWIERGRALNKVVAAAMQRRRKGAASQRKELQDALIARSTPIVVVVDDIDRLTSAEIREVFKLIRLTASFPNIVYVAAFDRVRVEKALSEDDIPGRQYLEKIVQLAVDLPVMPIELLQSRVLDELQQAINASGVDGPFDTNSWGDTFVEIVMPLLATPRDLRRLALSIYGTVKSIGAEVDGGDLIALDAVRIFLPDVYALLPGSVTALTATESLTYGFKSTDGGQKTQIESLIAAVPDKHKDVLYALVTRLFPGGSRHIGGTNYTSDWEHIWLSERRVAHRDILRLVLERVPTSSLISHKSAEAALLIMNDVAAFQAFFDPLTDTQATDALSALSRLGDKLTEDRALAGLVVSHNLLTRLATRAAGITTLEGRFTVGRLTYVLLSPINDPAKVLELTKKALPQIKTLYGQEELLSSVGHRENAGHKFITAEDAAALEAEWRDRVRNTSVKELAQEESLLYLLLQARDEAQTGEPKLTVPKDPDLSLAIFRSSYGEVRSSVMGNRAVSTSGRIAWSSLVTLFETEEDVKSRVDDVRPIATPEDAELIKLLDEYIGGWRPPENF